MSSRLPEAGRTPIFDPPVSRDGRFVALVFFLPRGAHLKAKSRVQTAKTTVNQLELQVLSPLGRKIAN